MFRRDERSFCLGLRQNFVTGEFGRVGFREPVLERLHTHLFLAEGFHGFDGCFGGLQRSNAGDAQLNGGGTNAAFISSGTFAAGRVDDQANLTIVKEVKHVRAAFGQLADASDADSTRFQSLGRSFRGHNFMAKRHEAPGDIDCRVFVPVADADEDFALRR